MKRLSSFLLAALVILFLFSASLAYAKETQATSGKPSAPQSHPKLFPTRTQALQQRAASASPNVYGSGDLIWNHGNTATTPRVYLIFWGASWSNAGNVNADGQLIENYFSNLGHTSFESILTQYYNFQGNISSSMQLAGIWLDVSTPPTDTTCGAHTIEPWSINTELNNVVKAGNWPLGSFDDIYFVYTPNGYYVNDGAGDCSEKDFCAYHGWGAGPYAAIPYPFNLTNCGVPSSPNANFFGDSLVNLTSQGQFAAMTDPIYPDSWVDSANFEIENKCDWIFPASPTPLNNGTAFEVQTEYSNLTSDCENSYTPAPRFQLGEPVYLTSLPTTSPSPVSFYVGNRGTATMNWSAGSLPSWVSISPTSGTIPGGGYQDVTLTFNLPNTPSPLTYTTNLILSDPNALNSPASVPITIVQQNVSRQWYFAEGFTGGSFSEFLTLENPNPGFATVQVRYLLGSGTPVVKQYFIPGSSRTTLKVNDEIGNGQDVSMVVTATQPIVAERPMYFTFKGLSGFTIPGGSDVLGATQLSQNFDFGYLDTTAGHATYLTILNQNSTTMNVTINYFPQAGGAPIQTTHQVAANSRGTVNVNQDGLAPGTYSALVSLDEPGLVERPLYLKDSTGNTGSADVVGVATLQTDWYFAEGFTSSTFAERYIVSNPSTTNTAHVTLTFFLSTGPSAPTNVVLLPGQQAIIDANAILGSNNVNNSAHVQADVPILAERFISFKYTGAVGSGTQASIPGASDVLGTAAPSNLFYFAEGYTGATFAEYLTIENPSATSYALVQVICLPANGGSGGATNYYAIAPGTRFTVFTNQVLQNQSFSMTVESNIPIVAERPMYFTFTGGQTGGSDVIGYQPPGVLPSTGLTVYTGDSSGNLLALDANTGNFRWSYQTSGPIVDSPAVANGMLYVGSDDKNFYALHTSDGSLAWKYQTGSFVESSPKVVNGIVYFASMDGFLYALNATTGALVWHYQLSGGTRSSPAISNGVVYIAAPGMFYAINATTGALVWSVPQVTTGATSPVVANNTVFVCANADLLALNTSDGSTLWTFHSQSVVFTGVEFCNLPVVSNNVVYVGGDDGAVHAFDASTGATIWNYSLRGVYPYFVGLGAGNIYLGDSNDDFLALDATTGNLVWKISPDAPATAQPLVVNGYVYLRILTGTVLVLGAQDYSLLWGFTVGVGTGNNFFNSLTVAP